MNKSMTLLDKITALVEMRKEIKVLKAAFQPIPIADMPEEMKDGRGVLFIDEDSGMCAVGQYKIHEDEWWIDESMEVSHYYTVLEHIQPASANNAHSRNNRRTEPDVPKRNASQDISKTETTEEKLK